MASATSTPVRPILKGSTGTTPQTAASGASTTNPNDLNDRLALLASPRTLSQRRVTFSPFTKQLQRKNSKNSANLAKRAAPLASWSQTSQSPIIGPQQPLVQTPLVFSLLESESTPARRAKMRRKERMLLKMMYRAAHQPPPSQVMARSKQNKSMIWRCVRAIVSKVAPNCGLFEECQVDVPAANTRFGHQRRALRTKRRTTKSTQQVRVWNAQPEENSLEQANREYLNSLSRLVDASMAPETVNSMIQLPKPACLGSLEALTSPPITRESHEKLQQQEAVLPVVPRSKEELEFERRRRELPGVRFAN